jgi:outer membrane lipoprotein SlyB
MGRFLAFLFVFFLGGLAGTIGGAVFGGVTGAYVGACKVVDTAVAGGTLTQEQANGLFKSIAGDLDIHPGDKQRFLDALHKANPAPSPCVAAIEAL